MIYLKLTLKVCAWEEQLQRENLSGIGNNIELYASTVILENSEG